MVFSYLNISRSDFRERIQPSKAMFLVPSGVGTAFIFWRKEVNRQTLIGLWPERKESHEEEDSKRRRDSKGDHWI
jgi:hypothetical protein